MSRRRIAGATAALLLLLLAAAAWLLGLLPGARGRYAASTPALAVAFRAKEGCTCLFVHRRSEADCRAWTTASPDLASLEVDGAARTVTSRALLLWSARARFVDERVGCVAQEAGR